MLLAIRALKLLKRQKGVHLVAPSSLFKVCFAVDADPDRWGLSAVAAEAPVVNGIGAVNRLVATLDLHAAADASVGVTQQYT